MIRLRITAQPAEPDEFRQQVDLIKASGAQFNSNTRTWWLTLTPDTLTPSRLNPLFDAAAQYHTIVEALQGDQEHA